MKQKTIFELEKIQYDSWKKPKYPEFAVERYTVGHFSSLAKAEKEMSKCVEEAKKNADKEYPDLTFGFMINELVLDKTTYWLAKKRRSYLADGSFWDETLVSEIVGDGKDGRLEEFLGRPADKIRFKKGDLVEVLFGDHVFLKVVGHLPRTPKDVQQLHEYNRKLEKNPDDYRFKLDYTDDGYYALNLNSSHGHPDAINMFPVRLKVSKKLREKFDAIYANPESWD
ncbi:MAG: hypothetical protein FWG79_06625 [Bacteroidales bacterium]|nr:hypothetical protein [Bacteroidales bacterium]